MAVPTLTPLALLAAVLGSAVAAFVWAFRDTSGAKPLAAFLICASLLSLAHGVGLAVPTLAGKIFWTKVEASVSPLLPVTWVVLVFSYTDYGWRLTSRRFALLLVEPVAFVALVWTNGDQAPLSLGGHGLVWEDVWLETAGESAYLATELGLGMLAHLAYAYFLVAASAFVVVRFNFQTNGFFRNQGTILLAAVCVPAGTTVLSLFGVFPPQYDLTGVSFVFAGVVVTMTLFRGRLLTVTPATRQLGRETVIDEMDDQILILDEDDHIVDVNPAAARLLDVDTDAVVGEPLDSVAPELADTIADFETGQTELAGTDGRHYYDVRVSPLYRGYGSVAGRLVSLRDVTTRRQREQRLDVLNRLLRHNLRNELNVVRGNAELVRDHVDDSEAARRIDRVQETIDTIVERSEKVGQISRTLGDETAREFPLSDHLGAIAAGVQGANPAANVTVDVPDDLTVLGGPSLERAFEELLANAVEHAGSEPTVSVTASRCDDGYVAVRVADDGPGIDRQERVVIEEGRETDLEHGSGVGLWLVNWVVREFGGSVEFDDAGEGCAVVVTLLESDGQQSTDVPEPPQPEGAD